jgi:Lrp/AsnC family transcriptional regulator, leucine-responsive regulatory protein
MNNLDKLDRTILGFLQSNADYTYEELAKLTLSSPATCQRRVTRLRTSGVIDKTVALINTRLVSPCVTALAEITLIDQNAEGLDAFRTKAQENVYIQQCYQVAGGPDFLLIITVRDIDTYHRLANGLFTAKNGIRNVRVFFSIERSKFNSSLPL